VLVRVVNPEIKQRLLQIFTINDEDDTLAWELGPDGAYRRLEGETVSAHDRFEALAVSRAEQGRSQPAALPPPLEAHERMDAKKKVVRAAGCVVWRPGPQGIEWLVAHRPRYDDWSFPKGKLDPSEEWLDGARREVEEETGLTGEIGHSLDDVEYVDHKGRDKIVRYWSMRATDGTFVANDEVDAVVWLSADDARDRLTYERDLVLLDQAAALVRVER
jgi:8-oxo-dGTP diphosphatase